MYQLEDNAAFHVHTYRCGHAEILPDEAYIERAIQTGYKALYFTDHGPFPENPYAYRMPFSQKDEYLDTLTRLKKEYAKDISIHVGFEMEYVERFVSYFEELRKDERIELLLLGQHLYTLPDGRCSWVLEEDLQEYLGLGRDMIAGIRSGLFDIVAHPDRIFRGCDVWDASADQLAKEIIAAAMECDMPLEDNGGNRRTGIWRPEFWNQVPKSAAVVRGLDAHALSEIVPPEQIFR